MEIKTLIHDLITMCNTYHKIFDYGYFLTIVPVFMCARTRSLIVSEVRHL